MIYEETEDRDNQEIYKHKSWTCVTVLSGTFFSNSDLFILL